MKVVLMQIYFQNFHYFNNYLKTTEIRKPSDNNNKFKIYIFISTKISNKFYPKNILLKVNISKSDLTNKAFQIH